MKMMRKNGRLIFVIFLLVFFFFGSVSAEEVKSGTGECPVPAAFLRFSENAAGRYSFRNEYETVTLELIPAFGRLFASVAYYMDGTSLYSYKAAELSPDCLSDVGNDSELSFGVKVRSFSNMSYAGNYWPGAVSQRLTLNEEGLLLSDFAGDGDALVSAGEIQLTEDPSAPSLFRYTPESSELPAKFSFGYLVPDALIGAWAPSESFDGSDRVSGLSFSADKKIMMLTDPGELPSEKPAGLYIGTYSLLNIRPDVYILCYLVSRPDYGMMPYEGCAQVQIGGQNLDVSRLESHDCLLIPETADIMHYSR